MLSAETKHRLGEFFHSVSENEKAVEVTRQILAETPSFSPLHLFSALDVSGLGLSTSDFIRFLTHMRIYCSANDAYLIVSQYDSNSDMRVNYDEFLQVTLPATSAYLRESAQIRSGYMSYQVEHNFSKLLDKEMGFQRDVELRKGHLKGRFDFNAADCFRVLDMRGVGSIDRNDLRIFMRDMALPIDEAGLDAIIRRLDHDADERLSYDEFVEALTPVGSPPVDALPRQVSMTSSPRRSSPLRVTGSPSRSPERDLRASLSSSYASRFESPTRASYLAQSSRVYQSKTLGPVGEQELISVLKQQVDLDREIERAKVSLTLMPDFNLHDAFQIFDELNKASISSYDLEKALNRLRVYAASDESDLIVRHFSKGGSRLNFVEFSLIFQSRDPEYERRLSIRPREGRRMFSYETEAKMQDLLRLQLRAEGLAESLRQRLARSLDFDMHRAFSDLDLDKDGFITENEFESMLRYHGLPVSQADLKSLMERYDKNGDGRVSYGEFVQEVRPQSPRKY